MSANTYGRQVVLPLTNKSGGGVVAGDVVVVDTTNNDAFTTTTSANFTGGVGIAQETIANNAVGRVLVSGYAALVNVNASVTRGHYGATYTVAKQATDAGAARTAGTFCQFLIGGTTPDALVYPVDLLGSSLTNPMSAEGDLIIGGVAGAPKRLADVATGSVLVSGGVGADPAYGYPPLVASETDLTAGDVAVTTAGTWYDVVSLTPAAGTYNIHGKLIWTTSVANTDAAYGRLLKGASTVLDESEDDVLNNAGQFQTMPLLAGNVAFDGGTTLKMQITGARNSTVTAKRDIASNSGGGHVDTKIVLLRVV